MAGEITHVLELDFYTTTSYPVVKAQQYDTQTRFLRVKLKDHEEDYNLPSGSIVTFKGLRGKKDKPEASVFEIIATIESSTPAIVKLDITQAITRAGVAVGNVIVTYGTSKLTSIPVYIDVTPEAASGASSEEDEQDVIERLTRELREHETDMVKHLSQAEHSRISSLSVIIYSSSEPSGQQKDDIWLKEYT